MQLYLLHLVQLLEGPNVVFHLQFINSAAGRSSDCSIWSSLVLKGIFCCIGQRENLMLGPLLIYVQLITFDMGSSSGSQAMFKYGKGL